MVTFGLAVLYRMWQIWQPEPMMMPMSSSQKRQKEKETKPTTRSTSEQRYNFN